MTIQIDYETEKKLDIDYTKLANCVAHEILETEQCPYDASSEISMRPQTYFHFLLSRFRLLQTIPLLRIRMNTLTWIQTSFCWEML